MSDEELPPPTKQELTELTNKVATFIDQMTDEQRKLLLQSSLAAFERSKVKGMGKGGAKRCAQAGAVPRKPTVSDGKVSAKRTREEGGRMPPCPQGPL